MTRRRQWRDRSVPQEYSYTEWCEIARRSFSPLRVTTPDPDGLPGHRTGHPDRRGGDHGSPFTRPPGSSRGRTHRYPDGTVVQALPADLGDTLRPLGREGARRPTGRSGLLRDQQTVHSGLSRSATGADVAFSAEPADVQPGEYHDPDRHRARRGFGCRATRHPGSPGVCRPALRVPDDREILCDGDGARRPRRGTGGAVPAR